MRKNKNQKVLNVNTVIEALVKYQECGDWSTALDSAVCPRKKERQTGNSSSDTSGPSTITESSSASGSTN